MPSARRSQTHENNRGEIKAAAFQQLINLGPSGLSLGAVARALDLTTPALYRYFKSREALLDELASDAWASFAAYLKAALDEPPVTDPAERFRKLCISYYHWAVVHPQQYRLLFESPLPSNRPDENFAQSADQCFLILLAVIDAADRDGSIDFSGNRLVLHPDLAARLKTVKYHDQSYSENVVSVALSAWSFLHGITSLEISQRYSSILGQRTEEFIKLEIVRFSRSVGL